MIYSHNNVLIRGNIYNNNNIYKINNYYYNSFNFNKIHYDHVAFCKFSF